MCRPCALGKLIKYLGKNNILRDETLSTTLSRDFTLTKTGRSAQETYNGTAQVKEWLLPQNEVLPVK